MWYELTTAEKSIYCCESHLGIVSMFWKDQEEYKKHPHRCVVIPRLVPEPDWVCQECSYQQFLYESTPKRKLELGGIHKFPKSTSFYTPKKQEPPS